MRETAMRNLNSSALVAVALIFILCNLSIPAADRSTPATPQSTSVDLRGVYIYTNDVSRITQATANSLTASFSIPGVDGVAVVIGWDAIEPAMGQYQWTLLDQWVGQAVTLNKKIDLVVMAGGSTPSWLFQPAPSGAGAEPWTFTISPHNGATNQCDAETIASPWDAAFLNRWDVMLAALAAHLKSAGMYNAITLVRLTGINRTTEELRLPQETPQSTGLACVSDAIATWQQAGYRPSLLQQGWSTILGSFAKSFPDKYFSVSLIPTSAAFPPIAEDGSLITGTRPNLTQMLLASAAQEFPGRLVVQFDFLMPGEPVQPDVITSAQTLGTLAAFQTNEYLGGQGAACSEPVTNPTPCNAATYLQLLETGIYPLGTGDSLRAQYIEVFHANASAFPSDILQAHMELFANPIDDEGVFVRQQYLDFLSREPDPTGLAFWTNQITSCGADQQCLEVKRINVSGAFYLSIEFQQTGYLVERIYKAAYGDGIGNSTLGGTHHIPVPIVRLNEFLADTQQISNGVIVNQTGWEQVLENNKQAFTAAFVQRARFTNAFPASMTAAQFVNALNANAGNPLSPAERAQLVSDLSTNTKTRAQVLRAVAEDPDLANAEFNRAFVLMQYFGYLRRNPNDPPDTDYTGYDFWLTKLNQFNGNFQNAEMVKAFITSSEYRQRFGQ
jgi:glycosyl hydrolase family 42 (putative beta-galactosidase)